MPDPRLIQLLRCPETLQPVRLLTPEELTALNGRLHLTLEGGLIREDGKVVFPIQSEIPVMLLDAAVVVG